MAISLADCEEMVRVAKEQGKRLMIGQNQRLTNAHQLAKKMIADGEIHHLRSRRPRDLEHHPGQEHLVL